MELSSNDEKIRKFLDETAIGILKAGEAGKGHLKGLWGISVSYAVFKDYPAKCMDHGSTDPCYVVL